MSFAGEAAKIIDFKLQFLSFNLCSRFYFAVIYFLNFMERVLFFPQDSDKFDPEFNFPCCIDATTKRLLISVQEIWIMKSQGIHQFFSYK